MTKIDYKRVKCPKCGKAYFRVKENNGFDMSLLVFTTKPDPIYKDGELQNPTEVEPIKVRCECLECGCNFRVETYDVFGEYRFVDEDEERKENERKLAESFKVLKKEAEEPKTKLVIGTPCTTESCQLKVIEPQFITADIKPPVDNFSNALRDIDDLKEELRTVKERLAMLEVKK